MPVRCAHVWVSWLQDIPLLKMEASYSVNKKVLKDPTSDWYHRYKTKKRKQYACLLSNLKIRSYLSWSPIRLGWNINWWCKDWSENALVMGSEPAATRKKRIRFGRSKIFIPMYGFTESFNISVSAAICLKFLLTKLRNSDAMWQLSARRKANHFIEVD